MAVENLALRVLSAFLNPVVAELVKKILTNNPGGDNELAPKVSIYLASLAVEEANDVTANGKVPTSNLAKKSRIIAAIEVILDSIRYGLKNKFEGSTTSEHGINLDKITLDLQKLTDQPSGESSNQKKDKQPKKQYNSRNKEIEDLPGNLKRCLLYCSLFPEGYVLNWKRIGRLLISHNFIKEESCKTTLKELATWLQVAERSGDGVPHRFLISTNVRKELQELVEKDFFGELPNSTQVKERTIVQRHIIDAREGNISKISDEKYLSSFVFLRKGGELDLKEREFMLLRVLSLRNAKLKNENGLKKLSLLVYLDLKYTNVRGCDWLEGLEELQTLDLRFTIVEKIRDEILKKLTRLQHLLLGYIPKNGAKSLAGAEIETRKLQTEHLQTLRGIRPPYTLATLRKVVDLFVTGLKTDQMEDFWKSVIELEYLKFLGVAVADDSVITLPNYQLEPNKNLQKRLQKLHLKGRISGTQKENRVSTSTGTHPELGKLSDFISLIDLTLATPIPIQSIPSLQNLLCLRLYGVCKEDTLTFRGEGFEKLIKLVIADMAELKSIEVGSCVMRRLATVKLHDLPQLRKLVSQEFGPILEIRTSQKQCTVPHYKCILSLKSIFLRGFKAIHVQRRPDAPNVYCYDM